MDYAEDSLIKRFYSALDDTLWSLPPVSFSFFLWCGVCGVYWIHGIFNAGLHKNSIPTVTIANIVLL